MVTKNDLRFGKRIKQLRKKAEYTQEQLAEKIKVSTKYIQFLESAKRKPSIKTLNKIARALSVKVKDLFTF